MGNKEKARKVFSRLGLAGMTFVIFSILVSVTVSVMMAASMILNLPSPSMDLCMTGVNALIYGVGGLLFWLIMRDLPVCRQEEPEAFGPAKMGAAFVICLAAMYIGNFIGLGLMNLAQFIFGVQTVNPVEEMVHNMDMGSLFLTTVVMAPIGEEILYRRILLNRVRQYGDKTAILASGLVFGLSHGNFYQFFYAFALGAIFAYIYLRTGKVRYTIILHEIINFIGSVLALQIAESQLLTAVYGGVILGVLVLGPCLFFALRPKFVFALGRTPVPAGSRLKVLLWNPGMVLFFLTSMILFLMG